MWTRIIYEEEYTDAETSINNKDVASDINDFEESEDNYEDDFEVNMMRTNYMKKIFETDHDVIEEDLDQKAGKTAA